MEKDEASSSYPQLGYLIDNKYLLEQLIGEVKSGNIYRATHAVTRHAVSIKILSELVVSEEKFTTKLKNELNKIGQLHHPGIVKITDVNFAEIDDKPRAYLVMGALDGEMLIDKLKGDEARQRRYPKSDHSLHLYETLEILTKISEVIDETHKFGITHQNLTTSNIGIDTDGNIKIFDFGLAGIFDNPTDSSEFLADEKLQKSIDIFTLAVLAYEMLSGEKPYEAPIREILSQHAAPPSHKLLRDKRLDLLEGISEIIDSNLSLDKSSCPPTAKAFVSRLSLMAYGLDHIRSKAKESYRSERRNLTNLTLRIWPIFIFSGAGVLLLTSLILSQTPPSINHIVAIIGISIFTFILYQAQNALTAAYTLLLDPSFADNKRRANIVGIVRLVLNRLPGTMSLSFYRLKVSLFTYIFRVKTFYYYATNTSLAHVDSIRTTIGSQEACNRSIKLISFVPLFDWNWLRRKAIYFSLCVCLGTSIFISLLTDSNRFQTYIQISTIVLLLVILYYSVISALETAHLYLNAVQAGGEISDNTHSAPVSSEFSQLRIPQFFQVFIILLVIIAIWSIINIQINNPGTLYRWSLRTAAFVDRKQNNRFSKIPIFNYNSNSNLISALLFNDSDEANRLIRLGQVNEVDNHGQTPLMVAILSNPEFVDPLLDQGSNVAEVTKIGSAVHIAAQYQGVYYPTSRGEDRNSLAKVLSRGPYANIRDQFGRTPLMVVCRYRSRYPDTSVKAAEILISGGADVNAKDNDGWTALMHAVKFNNLDVVTMLINKGADLNAISKNNMTAQKLCEINNQSLTSSILQILGNPRKVDDKKRTQLMALVDFVSNDLKKFNLAPDDLNEFNYYPSLFSTGVDTLIKAGVDVNAKDIEGKTALMLAMSKHPVNQHIVQVLTKYSSQNTLPTK